MQSNLKNNERFGPPCRCCNCSQSRILKSVLVALLEPPSPIPAILQSNSQGADALPSPSRALPSGLPLRVAFAQTSTIVSHCFVSSRALKFVVFFNTFLSSARSNRGFVSPRALKSVIFFNTFLSGARLNRGFVSLRAFNSVFVGNTFSLEIGFLPTPPQPARSLPTKLSIGPPTPTAGFLTVNPPSTILRLA